MIDHLSDDVWYFSGAWPEVSFGSEQPCLAQVLLGEYAFAIIEPRVELARGSVASIQRLVHELQAVGWLQTNSTRADIRFFRFPLCPFSSQATKKHNVSRNLRSAVLPVLRRR